MDNTGNTTPATAIPADFEYTFIPVDPASKRPALAAGFEYSQFEYGEDYRNGDLRQAGHVTSPQVYLYVIDVDGDKDFEYKVNGQVIASSPNLYPFDKTQLGGKLIAWMQAGSCPVPQYVREDGSPKAHLYVDAQAFGEDEFPGQWATHSWAYDIKAAGFVRAEPVYVNSDGTPPWRPTAAQQEEILAAIAQDRQLHDAAWRAMLAEHGIRTQGQGEAGGPWKDDGYRIVTHDEVPGTVAKMVVAGLTDEQIRERLDVIMPSRDARWPGRDDYISEKIDSARRKGYKPNPWVEASEDLGAAYALSGGFESYEQFVQVKTAEAQRGKPLDLLASYFSEEELPSESETRYEEKQAARVAEFAAGAVVPEEDLPLRMGSDQFLASQVLQAARGRYRPASDTGAWFVNRGTCWERFPGDPCLTIVAEVHRALPPLADPANFDPAAKLAEDDPEKELKKLRGMFGGAAGSARIAAKMRALAFSSKFAVREEDLDNDGLLLWAGGTCFDLRTLQPVASNDDTVHLLTASCAPAAGPTLIWDELNAAQFPDADTREYVLNVEASTLTGVAKLLPNFKSEGGLGKTTRLNALRHVHGKYAEELPITILSSMPGHDEVYLRLKGKRLVWVDEVPSGGKVAQEKLKRIAGGGSFTGRAIRGAASVTFQSQHTFMAAGNDDLPLTDPAVVSRIRYLPISGSKDGVDAVSRKIYIGGTGRFTPEFEAEMPMILWNLMLRASRVLADRSLTDMSLEALGCLVEAVEEQDVAARFVRECCEPRAETAGGFLYEEFVQWCKRNDIRQVPSCKKFTQKLDKLGYPSRKSNGLMLRPLSIRSQYQYR